MKCLRISIGLWGLLALTGCAGTPNWTQGTPDELRPYYYQGIGYSETMERADRNAYAGLVAERQGFQVESISEDMVRSVQQGGQEEVLEVFTSKGTITIQGGVPSGAYIADRASPGDHYWSYALLERPGKASEILQRRRDRLSGISAKSFVPGWAQFTKGQRVKGWRILGIGGISLAGAVALGVVSEDLTTRRDDARTTSDRDYYDLWANRSYWASVACGVLAGGAYMYSLIDGMVSEPKTHLLLSVEQHRDAVMVGLRYELP